MKLSTVLIRVVAVFVAISLAQIVAGMISSVFIPVRNVPPDAVRHFLQWMFITNAITVAALSVVALRTEWRGWTLGAAVAALPAAIAVIDGIEGSIFLKNLHIDWSHILLTTALASVLSVPLWMLFFGMRTDSPQEHFHPIASKPRGERAWKFVVCDISYILLYITAGTIILPYIKAFYATQTVPSAPTIFALQLLVRGPAFIVLCLLILRMLGLPRLSGALTVGAIFTLLSGVAPLLMPNPYFPDSVRWAHFFEVTISNFIFGAIVGWLWGQPRLAPAQVLRQAA